ncbi:MAG: flagellar assembly protein FliW [Epsilonproteobacteria bacterium]|nr:MAG: flagellar assembly protein FliW [Campylobacterota bacterium]
MQDCEVKSNILGFENIKNIKISKIDEMFSTMHDNDSKLTFTIVNPYMLREYSFDLPSDVKVLLGVKEDSNVSVYNIVVIQDPLEDSTVNFLAPIIVNNDNFTIAQAVVDAKRHPQFGMAESIKSFKTQE